MTSSDTEGLRAASFPYYGNEKFTDFTIICNSREYKVHRCFISAHSKYFDSVCSNTFAEANDRKIDLKEDLPEAVDCMIQYFYKLDYEDLEGTPETQDKDATQGTLKWTREPHFGMQRNAHVYAVADKYEAPGLKALALSKFKQQAARIQSAHSRILMTARTVYTEILLPPGDEELRSVLVDAWILRAGEASAGEEWRKRVRLYYKNIPEFAIDVNMRLLTGFQNRMWVVCPRCKKRAEVEQKPGATRPDCSLCRGGYCPKEDEAAILNNVVIKKFW